MKEQKLIEIELQRVKDERVGTNYEFIGIYLRGAMDALSWVVND